LAWQELSEKDPNLFISDWNHVGMTTPDILILIASRKKRYPIMICSGSAEENDIEIYRKKGLRIRLLKKPFTSENFNHQVTIHLRQ
jgi:CheY-like chemotaxis protein